MVTHMFIIGFSHKKSFFKETVKLSKANYHFFSSPLGAYKTMFYFYNQKKLLLEIRVCCHYNPINDIYGLNRFMLVFVTLPSIQWRDAEKFS